MTVRVTTLRGDEAGAYYLEQPGLYYLDGDEPDGVWRGGGATTLGLHGAVEPDPFLALMAGQDPNTGRLLGTKHTERTVRGFDITFSAPKSVSVLYGLGDREVVDEVLAAHDAAVAAVMDWIEEHSHVRRRVNGEIWTVDGEGTIAALFRQHTSRALDPQLHTHAVLVNRVKSADGRWLALDARTLKHDQRTLSALYHAALRAELTSHLAVRWQPPVNGIAEIADIDPAVLREFSRRTTQVDDRFEDKLDRFVASLVRLPTPRERWRMQREAALESRPPKSSADAATLREEWTAQLQQMGIEPMELIPAALHRAATRDLTSFDPYAIAEKAVANLTDRQSTWRPAELAREVAAVMPVEATTDAAYIVRASDGIANRIIKDHLVDLSRPAPAAIRRRRDGRPVTESALDRIITSPEILAQEQRLTDLAEARLAAGGIDHPIESDAEPELNGLQQRAAAAVAGERPLVLVVGPAGTGKTTALAPAVEQLRREGRAVFGVCLSAAAAEVLSSEAGVDADTLDKLLIEHDLERPPDHRYALPRHATIIVDEAAMVSTPKLAQLFDLAGAQEWRLTLIGDPLQFPAVGRSGMFGYLVDTFGAIELGQVHRFTELWERDASLQLRDGDTDAVALYDEHGRLHGGTAHQMQRAVVDAWWEATCSDHSALMTAQSREAVDQLNAGAQQRRIGAGELDPSTGLQRDGKMLLVGDTVATRHNERELHTDRGSMVRNRDRWTIDTVHADRSLTVTGASGQVRLPADYVAEHVELAYAETSHAAQGRTVDRSFLYLDRLTDTPGIYVPMSRGRDTNEAFVVLTDDQTPADVVSAAVARTWIDRPAIAQRAEREAGIGIAADLEEVQPPTPRDKRDLDELTDEETQRERLLQRAYVQDYGIDPPSLSL